MRINTWRTTFVVFALAAGVFSVDRGLANEVDDGPHLVNVPGPQVIRQGQPEMATWHALRYERPVRMLAILDKRTAAAPMQRIARRLRARLELRYISRGGGADEIYHVNDKWIEPKENPTRKELHAYAEQQVVGTLKEVGRSMSFDVVMLVGGADSDTVQAAAVECARAGVLLVVTGNVNPRPDSPFAEIWPASSTGRNSWHAHGAQPTDHPALVGVPVAKLRGHRWMSLLNPADGAVALAQGETGAAMLRELGRGKILYVPAGPISRYHSAIEEFGREFDHDEIWLRFWDHAIYELVHGSAAFPALARLSVPVEPSPAGASVALSTSIENRVARSPLTAAIHVAKPTGEVVYRKEMVLDIPKGQKHSRDIEIPLAESWRSGLYPVFVTVGDTAQDVRWHQAMDWISVKSPIAISVQTDQRGYRLGQDAKITVNASTEGSWNGELALGIYDFRGRLLRAESRPVTLSDQPQAVEFTYRLEDHGVRVDTVWVQVAARRDGTEWQRAETRFYKYEPWSTRNEYQWSTWSGIACGPPCTVPAGMRLMAHAGMNALGYPGRREIFYPAERWGWRYYNENIGVNTFSPVIEYENDAEIEASIRKEGAKKRDRRDLYSAAYALGSVGEEAGFKSGWGRRYYWDTPVAPEKANRAFQWFLRVKYASLQDLNRTWGMNYSDWDQLKLARELSPGRGGELVDFDADGWAHPQQTPLGEGVERITYAPVADTGEFYNWYYDRIIQAAKRFFHEQINPVTRVMASAPTIGTPEVYDVRSSGPSAWNDSQWHSLLDGLEPGFGLIWGHFDWEVKTDNMFWGWLFTRSGHNNYWVDVPLMFNNDMTHTRASFAMRQWTNRLAGHERIILDSRPAPTDVGVLPPNGLFQDMTRRYMAKSIRVAVSQAGFGLPSEKADLLGSRIRENSDKAGSANPKSHDFGYKIIFAVARQEVSPQEADRLEQFVKGGGTLVLTPRFSRAVAGRWGLRLEGERVPRHHKRDRIPFSLGERLGKEVAGCQGFRGRSGISAGVQPLGCGGQAEAWTPTTVPGMTTWAVFREQVDQQGWDQLAAYDDGTPAILTRAMGKGRLVYVNAVYNSHRYIQWVTPTDADRQGFFRLIECLCTQAGARRTMRIDGPLAETLHMAVKQFTDPTGQIRYALVRTSGEVPWTAGTLRWLDTHEAGYDVLRGESFGREVPIQLRPGTGRLLAFLPRAVKRIRLDVSPPKIAPGDALTVTPHVLDEEGQPIAGAFPFELRVWGGDTELPGLAWSFSASSGQSIVVNTALGDPAGSWQLRIRDSITGLSGIAEVEAVSTDAPRQAPRFIPWGWPSEIAEPATVTSHEFLSRLERLKDLYLTPQSDHTWLPKQRLGYSYDFFPDTRHALLRPLLDVDWREHRDALRRAVQQGATLVLTGEDLGLSPRGGLSTYPHHDAHQIEAMATALEATRRTGLQARLETLERNHHERTGLETRPTSESLEDADWLLGTRDGETVTASLGTGKIILCRESTDAAGHDNPSIVNWQDRWLAELDAGNRHSTPIPAPSVDGLRLWWIGEAPITDRTRMVTWLKGNVREVAIDLAGNEPLGKTFAFVLPPQGKLTDASVEVQLRGAQPIRVDIGCDGVVDTELQATGTFDWTDALQDYEPRYRDGNNWRIIPVRLRSDDSAHVVVRNVVLTVGP